jgi:spoIIIJ-associated protein
MLLERMGIEALVHTEMVDGNTQLIIDSKVPSLLIGRHGQTLDAIQYLVNCIFNKSALVKKKIIVNSEGYRERREEMLVELAYRLSSKVKQTGRELVMNPLPPHERRIVHVTLQNDDRIRTYSRGEGPMRSVVITTKDRFEYESRFQDNDRH